MKNAKRMLVLALMLALCLTALAMPSASAENGVKARFGANAVFSGTDLLPEATGLERNRQIGGHKSGE